VKGGSKIQFRFRRTKFNLNSPRLNSPGRSPADLVGDATARPRRLGASKNRGQAAGRRAVFRFSVPPRRPGRTVSLKTDYRLKTCSRIPGEYKVSRDELSNWYAPISAVFRENAHVPCIRERIRTVKNPLYIAKMQIKKTPITVVVLGFGGLCGALTG